MLTAQVAPNCIALILFVCDAERASRLDVKLVSHRTQSIAGVTGSTSSRPASAAVSARSVEQQQQQQVEEEVLLDLPSPLSIENKTLPHLVVLSIRESAAVADLSGATSDSVTMQGESRRQIRLRVFEGQFDSSTAAAAVSARASPPTDTKELPPAASAALNDEQQEQAQQQASDEADTPRSAQWYFVLPDSASTDTSSSLQTARVQEDVDEPAAAAVDGAEPEETGAKESRVSEVVVETSDGKASVERLALPASTLPGSYYVLVESLASSDALPTAVIHLTVA